MNNINSISITSKKPIKYIKYSIEYHKKDKTYYVWKTLYRNNVPTCFRGIYNGSKNLCLKYCKENKINLKEKILLPS